MIATLGGGDAWANAAWMCLIIAPSVIVLWIAFEAIHSWTRRRAHRRRSEGRWADD